MWNTFILENETYIIKINHFSTYNIILSNLVSIWNEELNTDDIVSRCKDLNPIISTDNETFIKMALSILDNKLESNINLIKNGTELKLEYTIEEDNIPFKFNFHLKLNSGESLCKEIIVPTIHTIQYLENREKKLCELLRKKDEEIQQHVFENGNLKRVDVVTEKFDKTSFEKSTSKTLCCNLFTNSDFNKVLMSKYGCTEPDLMTVKKEEKTVKKHKISVANQILKSKKLKTKAEIKIKNE